MGKETELRSVILPAGFKHDGYPGSNDSKIVGPIRHASLPSTAVIPLVQHVGVPARSVVRVGDEVREGMLIAAAAGPFSSSVHSPVPGIVTAFRTVILPSGAESPALFIELGGEFDRLGKRPTGLPAAPRDRAEGLSRLERNGVIDAGQSDLPLPLVWRKARGESVDHLIVSALPRDPYLGAEELLLGERPEEIARGIEAACMILNPQSISLALSRPVGEAASAAGEAVVRAAGARGIVVALKHLVPDHRGWDERRLTRQVAGRTIARGESAAEAGVVIAGVSTLLAVADAFDRDLPMIERTIVVAGGAVREPAALRVRVGTRIGELFEECGGLVAPPERVVCGGAMTGGAVRDLGTPVTKTTEAVLALSKKETNLRRRSPCIGCGLCAAACPEGLLPSQLFKLIEHGDTQGAQDLGIADCTECGWCSYVCPSHIPLAHGLRIGKQQARRERERQRL